MVDEKTSQTLNTGKPSDRKVTVTVATELMPLNSRDFLIRLQTAQKATAPKPVPAVQASDFIVLAKVALKVLVALGFVFAIGMVFWIISILSSSS